MVCITYAMIDVSNVLFVCVLFSVEFNFKNRIEPALKLKEATN